MVGGIQITRLAAERIQPSSSMTHEVLRAELAHTCTDWSGETEVIWLALGKSELWGSLSCLPVLASHTRTDRSKEPDTIWLPSGENATELT